MRYDFKYFEDNLEKDIEKLEILKIKKRKVELKGDILYPSEY